MSYEHCGLHLGRTISEVRCRCAVLRKQREFHYDGSNGLWAQFPAGWDLEMPRSGWDPQWQVKFDLYCAAQLAAYELTWAMQGFR